MSCQGECYLTPYKINRSPIGIKHLELIKKKKRIGRGRKRSQITAWANFLFFSPHLPLSFLFTTYRWLLHLIKPFGEIKIYMTSLHKSKLLILRPLFLLFSGYHRLTIIRHVWLEYNFAAKEKKSTGGGAKRLKDLSFAGATTCHRQPRWRLDLMLCKLTRLM